MADKFMFISNDDTQMTTFEDYNNKLKHFETPLNEPTKKTP